MTTVPGSCTQALEALEADPLNLSVEVEAHLRTCPACAEARVLWLAQMEDALPLVPAGYFDHLPQRVLRKLPPPRLRRGIHPALLAAAGVLAMALGIGGFWLGRAHRTPVVEATLPKAPAEAAPAAEAPFHEGESPYTALDQLSPEEAKAVLERLESTTPNT